MPNSLSTPLFDAAETARLTPYPALVDALATAVVDYTERRIASPERLVVPLNDGGVLLSMPATAPDLAIHKLVNVCPRNRERGLPTIHGQVMAIEPDTGETLFILDGPTVTGRRTAAMTMLGVRTLSRAAPRDVLLIGTGTQAANHLEALRELYPDALVRVRGTSPARSRAFCDEQAAKLNTQAAAQPHALRLQPVEDTTVPDSVDLVITLTTSRAAVYDEAPRARRLVVGVGAFKPDMAELGARTLNGSALYVDDPAGAKHEAGDLIQAGVDWTKVAGIVAALGVGAHPASGASGVTATGAPASSAATDDGAPRVFKTVGCAAWDLAAGRVARGLLDAG